jgi:predicted metalloprotease with PDZ domain
MRKGIATLLLAFAFGVTLRAATPIRLSVDATDAPRKLLHARITLPVQPGPLTLWYPKWIPGEHGPTGPLVQMAGLKISANGSAVRWSRDLREMYAFHVDVPPKASELTIELDYLDPASGGQFTAGGSMTPQLGLISWNTVLLYPQSKSSDELTYEATLRLPSGWSYATALETASAAGGEVRFAPVSLTKLVDSPVLAGAHLKKVALPSSSPFEHRIDIAADGDAALKTPDDFAASYGRMVDEARALFGAEHFRHYDWLVTLSNSVAHFGLEHHQSSDDRMDENVLGEEATRRALAGLLAHEYAHSWNGKHRRPAGLATPNYDVPMTGEHLWIYEGLTQYLGNLLAYRSALWSPEHYREQVAVIAASLAERPGRAWRPLEDTAVEAQVLYGAPGEWAAYRRGVDFYDEGLLLWLDADMTIRKATAGKKSLDDFLKRFYGGADGDPVVRPYTFDEVVRTLNDVAPMDWASFLNTRIRSTTNAPLGGIENSGWRLVMTDKPNTALEAAEKRFHFIDATATLGFVVAESGRVNDVMPAGLAGKAGVVPGARLVAVNGRRFTPDALRNAIRDSKETKAPIEFIVESGDFFNTAAIDYHGGLRYPHLERVEGMPDRLAELGKPKAAAH